MAIYGLKDQIGRLPEQPGVYVFSNTAGETLYVGKARVLRDRVRSYLAAMGASPRIDRLLMDAAGLEVIVTDSVAEALALENQLIKQRNPRYNILLRDDKTYPYLRLTMSEPAPRVLVARRVERDGDAYFGPFMPAALGRRMMGLTHRLFGLRSCNEIIDGNRGRPCLEYDIKRCIAPCVSSLCSFEQYGRAVAQARLLLDGQTGTLIDELRRDMTAAASEDAFERAAQLRDAIRTIETVASREQKMDTPALGDRDAFGLKVGPAGAVVQVFQMRRGRVVDRIVLVSEEHAPAGSYGASPGAGAAPPRPAEEQGPEDHPRGDLWTADVLTAAVQQFYAERQAPPEVHLPIGPAEEDRDAIETWLGERAGRKVRLVVPKRGEKRGLLDLATRNAVMAYHAQFDEGVGASFDALEALRAALTLAVLPRRIECFDISTLQGSDTVASMVVCVEGRMKLGEYRKFRVKGAGPMPDDFAAMREVVLRRYQRVLAQGGPFPDLILIDGGKGQLSAAYDALREVGLERLVAAGLAKQEELLFTRDRLEGLALPRESPALHLVQRIRDEAHRFAVTFHRQSRKRRTLRSELDEIAGVGPRRRRELLTRFGSVAGVRRASREELTAAVGAKAAEAVLRHFN
jgi:excinuclease ABC subunit C